MPIICHAGADRSRSPCRRARRATPEGEFITLSRIRRSSCSSPIRRPATSRRRSRGLVEGIDDGLTFQTLLGVTGSGKTFTMANVIARMGRPAIVFAPNKTLAAQLYSEFREFFPKNAVEYFVSYYDYYQPEAYVPQRDLFIEKDSSINEHIEQMRLSATKSVLERRDIGHRRHRSSAIYGIGTPEDYTADALHHAHRRQARPARRHRAADPHAVHAQRDRLLARHLPRARRHDRRLPGRAHASWRSASSCSTTRSSRCSCSIR